MSDVRHLLERLWEDYARLNPEARRIRDLLAARGEQVVNDHIALRTFGHPRVGIDVIARPFVAAGYRVGAEYEFPDKRLSARHYELAEPDLPLVFVSELDLGEEFSNRFLTTVRRLVDQVPASLVARDDLVVSGRAWQVSHAECELLRAESEYAAWLAAFGFRANHFTLSVNALETFDGLAELDAFLEANGFALNTAGGKIKGSPDVFLEQSSTLAGEVDVELSDGVFRLPGCYYEFARRYPLPSGELFRGFVERSADRIFESTNRR